MEEIFSAIVLLFESWWREISAAIIVFLLFLLFRKIFAHYIFKIILRFTRKSPTELDTCFLLAFEGPLRALFIIIGIYIALTIRPLTAYQDFLLLKFFRSALIVLVTWGGYNLASSLLCEDMAKKLGFDADRILVSFLSKVARFIVIALSVSIIAQEWGFEVSGLIAGLGLGGLAISLAAKDALANIFGGIVIITDKPFTIGDWIATPSVEGTVEEINFRSTRVRTFANSLVIVPNSKLADEPITNWTRMGKRRISFHLGVTYTTPAEKLKKCVEQIREYLQNHPGIHKETIFVRFDRFNDSSLDIFLYFFTITTVWGEFMEVKEEVNFKIMEILEGEGVSVAFPSRSLYLETPLQLSNASENREDNASKVEQPPQ